MYMIVAVLLVVGIGMQAHVGSFWIVPLIILAGIVFVPLHHCLVKKVLDAPIGIASLQVVLAFTISIMMPHYFVPVMQVAGLFLAGTLLATAGKDLLAEAKVG